MERRTCPKVELMGRESFNQVLKEKKALFRKAGKGLSQTLDDLSLRLETLARSEKLFIPLVFSEDEDRYLFLQIAPNSFSQGEEGKKEKKAFVKSVLLLRDADREVYKDRILDLQKCLTHYLPKSGEKVPLMQLFSL